MERRIWIFTWLLMLTLSSISLAEEGIKNVLTPPHGIFKNVTAVTEPSGQGEKLTAVIVEMTRNVRNNKITKDTFKVEGRKVERIYSNSEEKKATNGKDGRFIIIELSAEEESAKLRVQGRGFKMNEPVVKIVQNEEIVMSNGEKYRLLDSALSNNKVKRLVVEDFKQLEFKDSKTGVTLKYNLYIPKNYNKNKKYPLVLFMHDAGVLSEDTTSTLRQGNGATVWATSESQAKNEAFVLAPQYSVQVVNDKWEATADLEATVNLLNDLLKKYSIDSKRLYTTGQSMGGMMSAALNIKYPDLFAATYLVACQWDYFTAAPMSKNKVWITVSTGDLKAYPGMNAMTTVFEQNGGVVGKAAWQGNETAEGFNKGVSEILVKNPSANVYYTTLEKGTIPGVKSMANAGGAEHVYTWTVAYNIEGIRDWIFKQKK